MTANSSVNSEIIALLLRLEEERCSALDEHNWATLEALLSEDYIHTHSTGVVQDKSTYIAYIKASPRTTNRGDLEVRLYGDVAVMTGPLFLTLEGRAPNSPVLVIQVWVKKGDRWKTVAFQSTKSFAS